MIKTLAAANKSERETFKIPRSVQQSIPIQRVFRDGIWKTGRNRYSPHPAGVPGRHLADGP